MKTRLKPPTIPEGLELVSDNGVTTTDLSQTVLHYEPEQETEYIQGTKLLERLKDKAPLSASVLDYLIEHPEETPESWKGKYTYFFGTIYRDRDGRLCVRYLYWDDGRWYWSDYWLGSDWDDRNPAALLAVSSSSNTKTSPSDTQSLELRLKSLEEFRDRVVELIPSLESLENE